MNLHDVRRAFIPLRYPFQNPSCFGGLSAMLFQWAIARGVGFVLTAANAGDPIVSASAETITILFSIPRNLIRRAV